MSSITVYITGLLSLNTTGWLKPQKTVPHFLVTTDDLYRTNQLHKLPFVGKKFALHIYAFLEERKKVSIFV